MSEPKHDQWSKVDTIDLGVSFWILHSASKVMLLLIGFISAVQNMRMGQELAEDIVA